MQHTVFNILIFFEKIFKLTVSEKHCFRHKLDLNHQHTYHHTFLAMPIQNHFQARCRNNIRFATPGQHKQKLSSDKFSNTFEPSA